MIKVQFVDMCLSNADRKLLISYLSHDRNLSQDLRDIQIMIQTRLQLAYTLESFDDDFTSPTPQAAGLGVCYQVGYLVFLIQWTEFLPLLSIIFASPRSKSPHLSMRHLHLETVR